MVNFSGLLMGPHNYFLSAWGNDDTQRMGISVKQVRCCSRAESEDHTGEKAGKKGSTLPLRPKANVTRSAKQGYQRPHEKRLMFSKFEKTVSIKETLYCKNTHRSHGGKVVYHLLVVNKNPLSSKYPGVEGVGGVGVGAENNIKYDVCNVDVRLRVRDVIAELTDHINE